MRNALPLPSTLSPKKPADSAKAMAVFMVAMACGYSERM